MADTTIQVNAYIEEKENKSTNLNRKKICFIFIDEQFYNEREKKTNNIFNFNVNIFFYHFHNE